MLLANGAVLGHVASSLAHEPDGSALDGLGFAGANEDGIGRRHEPTTLAFLIQRGLCRGGATARNEDQLPTSPAFVSLCWAHLLITSPFPLVAQPEHRRRVSRAAYWALASVVLAA